MKYTGTKKMGLDPRSLHLLQESQRAGENALMQRTSGLGLLTLTTYDGEDSITAATDTLKQ